MSNLYKINISPHQDLYNELVKIILAYNSDNNKKRDLIRAIITQTWSMDLVVELENTLTRWRHGASISDLVTNNNETRYTFISRRFREATEKAIREGKFVESNSTLTNAEIEQRQLAKYGI